MTEMKHGSNVAGMKGPTNVPCVMVASCSSSGSRVYSACLCVYPCYIVCRTANGGSAGLGYRRMGGSHAR